MIDEYQPPKGWVVDVKEDERGDTYITVKQPSRFSRQFIRGRDLYYSRLNPVSVMTERMVNRSIKLTLTDPGFREEVAKQKQEAYTEGRYTGWDQARKEGGIFVPYKDRYQDGWFDTQELEFLLNVLMKFRETNNTYHRELLEKIRYILYEL